MATALSLKHLTIAEWFQRLSQFNRNRSLGGGGGSDGKNNSDGNGRLPPPTQLQPLTPPYNLPHRLLSLLSSDDGNKDDDAPPPLAPAQKLAQK